MPPWVGVMGGALTAAANAYLNALLDEPYDKEKLRKEQLSNDLLTEQIEQTKANTGWLNRRTSSTDPSGARMMNTKLGPVIVYPDGTYKQVIPTQTGPVTLKGLKDQIAGQLAADPSLLYDPEFREFSDRLGVTSAPYQVVPGDAQVVPRRELADRMVRPGQPAPATPAVPEGGAAPAAPAGRTGSPKLPPPQARAVAPLPEGLNQDRIAWYETYFRSMPLEQAKREAARFVKEDRAGTSIRTWEVFQAMDRILGPSDQGKLEVPAGPQTSSAPPPATAPLAGPAPAPGVEGIPGTVQIPPSPRQRQQEADRQRSLEQADTRIQQAEASARRAEEQLQLSKENAERLKRSEERLRQSASSRDHLQRLRLAKDQIDELDTLTTTEDLVARILPLLKQANVGPQAYISMRVQGLLQNFGFGNPYENAVEQKLRALPGLSEEVRRLQRKAMLVAIANENQHALYKTPLFNPEAPMLEVLTHVLQYAHAAAQKRVSAGSGRGVTVTDINLAKNLFDPYTLFSSASGLMARISALNGFIQEARPRIEERVRSYGLDPKKNYAMLPSRGRQPQFHTTEPQEPGLVEPGSETPLEEDPNDAVIERLNRRYGRD